ncbi:60S ribosomal protein like [Actinidia chinensis var. chinensis]|uniref:60S ribosomal protein like n=1 Tax=Actinidia chinensis var. chinensis TaxID=1590841 RepID=A0A2R6PJZ6_ACTCC|nr:60S ribosomal protein like [Actinidia chinensis var. chinensis]
MASFWFLSSLIMASMAFPSLSSSPTTTISAAPALLPSPPLSPPSTELSPDISPLLPSPTGSSIPTIPSNPSPPNPDEIPGFAPDFAVSPSGSKLISASSSLSLFGFLNLAVLVGLVSIW